MEIFDIINEDGVVIGSAPRKECHGDPSLLHRAVHVVVIHPGTGDILLQKRTLTKDIQPGKWDTAVGGHLDCGEQYEDAALREMKEELGLVVSSDQNLIYLFDSQIRNAVESENIRVYAIRHSGPFTPQVSEVESVRFWTHSELLAAIELDDERFTPNLKQEIPQLMSVLHLL